MDKGQKEHVSLCVCGHVDAGKCLALDTLVLMSDGSQKKVQDIRVGDKVKGDNGEPRQVLKTLTGRSEMFKVSQDIGFDYTVTANHLLVLENSENNIVEIKAKDFSKYAKEVQESYKGIKSNANFDDTYKYQVNVKPVGYDNYYGFEIDGNHRFLLGDYTVTHNSTTCGHLLFELGGVSDREVEKLKAEAEAVGKGSFAFAFYMDKQKDERERGITISCATKEFFTETKHYTIIDAPGHKDFILNMIKGAAQADVGLLMVPAGNGFATATAIGNRKKGQVEGQSRQHAFLLSLLGIKQLIVGVNKMDDVKYSEDRFNEIKAEMVHMLSKSGWRSKFVKEHVPIIPISGYHGENLLHKSKKMPWWKGTTIKTLNKDEVHVHTLVEAFEKMVVVPKRNTDGKLRVPISGVYNIKGVGDVITGRVEQGTLKPGTEVKFLPTHTAENTCAGKVFTVEMHHKSVEGAYPGDNVGMNVKNLPKDKKRKPRVGDVMVVKSDDSLKECKSFTMKAQVLNHPGELKVGYSPIGVVRTGRSALKITEIKWKKSNKKGSAKIPNPHFIKQGDSCELVIEPQQNFVVEKFKNCEGLGRVALLDGNSVVMVGMVLDVDFK